MYLLTYTIALFSRTTSSSRHIPQLGALRLGHAGWVLCFKELWVAFSDEYLERVSRRALHVVDNTVVVRRHANLVLFAVRKRVVTYRTHDACLRVHFKPIFTTCESHTANIQLLPRDAMLARYMLSFCVCPSVRLSQACIVQKPLNVGSRRQRRTVARGI